MHSQLLQSKFHSERLSRELQEAGQLNEKVESLQTELGMMVPRGQFEAICKDFESSLKREKELKIYLSQHVSVVEQLQTKLQLAYQEMQCKETTLTKSSKVTPLPTHNHVHIMHLIKVCSSLITKTFSDGSFVATNTSPPPPPTQMILLNRIHFPWIRSPTLPPP